MVLKYEFGFFQERNFGKCARNNDGLFVECPQCGKKCYGRNRNQNLSHHMATHNDLRPIKCSYCPHRAASDSHLIRHITIKHIGFPLPSVNVDFKSLKYE